MDKTFSLLVALGGIAVLLTACGEREMVSKPASPATQKTAIAPIVPGRPSFDGKWSEEIRPYPGFPLIPGEQQEWSHSKIAQRHKALVMKDLPTYITNLRGLGAVNETLRTSAAWFFTVPKERLPDFENYLHDLGIPREAFHEHLSVAPPADWIDDGSGNRIAPPPPNPPAEHLIFGSSETYKIDGKIMGMPFGAKTTTYFQLNNPNIAHAAVLITYDFRSGNAQFAENPLNPNYDD